MSEEFVIVLPGAIDQALDDYWNAAYREGKEGRDTDDGSAQAALSAIQGYVGGLQDAARTVVDLHDNGRLSLVPDDSRAIEALRQAIIA